IDHCGNSSTASQTIHVADTKAPVITCSDDITVGECHNVVTFQSSATDLCAGPVPVKCTPPSGSTFPVGQTIVTCAAQDPCGNRATCSFTVTVTPNPVCQITGPSELCAG